MLQVLFFNKLCLVYKEFIIKSFVSEYWLAGTLLRLVNGCVVTMITWIFGTKILTFHEKLHVIQKNLTRDC